MDKRRDNRNRVLQEGEYQRPSGKYEFKYLDSSGQRKSIYSWRLIATDKNKGRHSSPLSLREMEKDIRLDVLEGYETKNISVNGLVKLYFDTKIGIRPSTLSAYQYQYDTYIRDEIGSIPISKLKYSDIRTLYKKLLDNSLSGSTVLRLDNILSPAFGLAVRNMWLRKNPCEGVASELKKLNNFTSREVHPLTPDQQRRFVEFVKNSNTYCFWANLITFLLGTGVRIGEAVGLEWDCVDFENEVITIQQALVTSCEADGKEYQHITAPKTENGIRTIPMLSDVRTALLNQQEWMSAMGGCQKPVDGHRDFVFMNTKGNTVSKSSFNHVLSRIIQAMNKKECESAEREGRAPDLMPHISAHVLRHTFCTRFAENDPNADTLQKIMGHSDIRITYQVYNEVSNEKKKISFRNLEGKFSL